jgi:oligoendopeptidase F
MKLSAIALAAALATLAAPLTHAASAPAVAPAASTPGNPPALWNLTSLYADDAAWQASREKIIARLPELKALQGTLGASAASLLHAMQTISDVNKEINRLDAYASLKADADTQVTANEALRQQSSALQTQVAQATAWEAP